MNKAIRLLCALACLALLPASVLAEDAAQPFQGLTPPAPEHPAIVTSERAVDRPAPAYKFKDLSGKKVSLASLKGKVVLVDFWATWCDPCRTEIPHYIEMQKKYGPEGLVIIGVSVDTKKPAVVKKFAEEMGMNYIIGMRELDDIFEFGLDRSGDIILPTTFLINRAGRIIHEKQGLMDFEKYEAIVKQAL